MDNLTDTEPQKWCRDTTPRNYFREAIEQIVGKPCPFALPAYGPSKMGDQVIDLQDWCCLNTGLPWLTGIGIIDAAELLVREAIDNANIPPEKP